MIRRLFLAACTTVAAVVLSLVASPAHAAVAAPSYAALGDSYASGLGAGSYYSTSGTCYRSSKAYGPLLAAQRGYSLNFRACAGATSSSVISGQVPGISIYTRYVTVSAGGNDVNFGGVLRTCATGSDAQCSTAINQATTLLPGMNTKLGNLYRAIKNRAKSATVVAVGYPRLFNGAACPGALRMNATERNTINARVDRLNAIIRSVAAANGVRYANAQATFGNHGVCAPFWVGEWINGAKYSLGGVGASESYHPKAVGHSSGYLPAVRAVM